MVLGYLKDVLKFTKNYFCQVVILLYRNNNSHFANWCDKRRQNLFSSITTSKIKFNSNTLLRQGEQMFRLLIHGEQVKIFQWLFLWSVYFERFEGVGYKRWVSNLLERAKIRSFNQVPAYQMSIQTVYLSQAELSSNSMLCSHPISECHSYLYKNNILQPIQVSRKIQWKDSLLVSR